MANVASRSAAASASNGVMSLKTMPDLGKSGTSRISAVSLDSSARVDVAMLNAECRTAGSLAPPASIQRLGQLRPPPGPRRCHRAGCAPIPPSQGAGRVRGRTSESRPPARRQSRARAVDSFSVLAPFISAEQRHEPHWKDALAHEITPLPREHNEILLFFAPERNQELAL